MAKRVTLVSYITRRKTKVSAKTAARVAPEIERRQRATWRRQAH